MATLPVYRTWVAGEVVTAAYFNSNVRDAGNFWLSVPTFEGRQTVAQSLTSGTGAAITFDAEDFDNDNGHSTVSNTSRYTPQTPGRFQHSGGVGFASSASGSRWAYWCLNGTPLFGASQSIPGNIARIATPTLTSVVNGSSDFLELFALQNTGGALNTDVNTGALGYQSRMSVRWVGAS